MVFYINMCGIFGATGKNIDVVKSLINTSSHRGPDGSSIWHNEHMTLGQNLLAITDNPATSKQPWVSDKGNVLVYNGELFNYKELCKQFSNQFRPKTNCDTELLMWLLENKSIEEIMNNLIDSMHAFAFYIPSKHKLILSRDHAGIKPLYFYESNNNLLFGSEIKGLKKHVPCSNNIHPQSLVCMAYCGMNFLRNTMFEGIKKVNTGETLVYDLNKRNFIGSSRNIIIPKSSKKLNTEEFHEEINSAIKKTTLGIRKFGVFLSGGLDSSLLTLELRREFPDIETYTNFFTPNIIDEKANYNEDFINAKKFCEDFKIKNNPVEITPQIIANNWSETMRCMEEPRYNWNLPMYYYTNQYLSKNNTVVTFSGDMGDELLGGYEKYFHIKNNPRKPKNWEELVYLWMHRFAKPIRLNLKFDLRDLHKTLCKELPNEVWNPEDPLNSLMALDSITCVTEDFFTRNDKFGMAASMEGRFPFASKKFMKYALDIHSNSKIGESINDLKLPIKSSYNNILPKYIINKNKSGWSLPIMNWLENDNSLKSLFSETINKNDCLKNIISDVNFKFSKPKIISWMMRSWSQEYNLNFNL